LEVTTTQARIDMARARKGEIPLPKITHIAFGTGGHAPGDPYTPLSPSPDDTQLENEVLRKTVTVSLPIATTIRYTAEILSSDGIDGTIITEAGLLDENGTLVARKTFPGKEKTDLNLKFDWDEVF